MAYIHRDCGENDRRVEMKLLKPLFWLVMQAARLVQWFLDLFRRK